MEFGKMDKEKNGLHQKLVQIEKFKYILLNIYY